MKRVWQWIEAGFALTALAIVIAFLVYAFKLHSEGAAAWVQALGSIAAIGGAYWIGERQSAASIRSVREMDQITIARRLSAYAAVIKSAHDQAQNVAILAQRLNRDQFLRTWVDQNEPVFRSAFAATENIPLHDLGSAEGIRAFILMKTALGLMGQVIEEHISEDTHGDALHANFQRVVLGRAQIIRLNWQILATSLHTDPEA